MRTPSRNEGFTLIELLIVIGIIGFLAAAILVAVDPVKRIQDSRNSHRWSEVNAILNAILKYQVDNRALFGGGDGAGSGNIILTSTTANNYWQIIIDNDSSATAVATCATTPSCTGAGGALNPTDNTSCYADLDGLTPTYLAEVPTDPNGGTSSNTGYYIRRTTGNRIEIGACNPEQSATINVKR